MRFLIAAIAMLATPALAQPTPETQALQAKLMQELNAALQCSAMAITLQQQLATAQSEVKRLTEKYEPKEKPDAK